MQRMKFRRRNNLRQLLHINRFYIDNISHGQQLLQKGKDRELLND